MGTVELLGKPIKLQGVTCDGLTSPPVGVEILLLHATETGISFNSYEPVGSKASHWQPQRFNCQALTNSGCFPLRQKITVISVRIQMKKSVSVSSNQNIQDHLWSWSTYFGWNIPTEIWFCPN